MTKYQFQNDPILVIGVTGQLGRAILAQEAKAVGVGRESIDLSSGDVTDQIAAYIETIGPISGIINAAAYTAVDKAEDEIDLANKINGTAPGELAKYCALHDMPFVHVSTDYVFSGQSEKPYLPSDEVAPVNAYGYSKRLGELSVIESYAEATILRTSWVYDNVGRNFLTTMLRLGRERDEISVVDDQVGRPTFAFDLAAAALSAFRQLADDKKKSGIYHVTNSGPAISWAEFASSIFEISNIDVIVKPISTREYPTPAKRPAYSVLNLSNFEETFDYALPSWRNGLGRALLNP